MDIYKVFLSDYDVTRYYEVYHNILINDIYKVNKENEYKIVKTLFNTHYYYTVGETRKQATRFVYLYDELDKNNQTHLIDNFYKNIYNDDSVEYKEALNELVTYIVDIITFDNFVKLIICGKTDDLEEVVPNDGYPNKSKRNAPNIKVDDDGTGTFLYIIKDQLQ